MRFVMSRLYTSTYPHSHVRSTDVEGIVFGLVLGKLACAVSKMWTWLLSHHFHDISVMRLGEPGCAESYELGMNALGLTLPVSLNAVAIPTVV